MRESKSEMPLPKLVQSRCLISAKSSNLVFISAVHAISFSEGAFKAAPRMPRTRPASVSSLIYMVMSEEISDHAELRRNIKWETSFYAVQRLQKRQVCEGETVEPQAVIA